MDTAVFGGVNTTITLVASATVYSYGTIAADADGDSVLFSTVFKCLSSGTYYLKARAAAYGIHVCSLRLVNIDGFRYDQYGAITADGGTTFPTGMVYYVSTTPVAATYDMVVSLVAGEHYEIQQWADDAQADSQGLGSNPQNLPTSVLMAEIIVTECG